MTRIIHADLELFLTEWLRRELAQRPEPVCQGVEVSNREPPVGETFPARLVVVRDDSGNRTSIITRHTSVGISVLAGTKDNPQDATDLARIVLALAEDCAAVEPGNPVAAVLESNGPYPVPEAQPHSRRYMTLVMSVVGSPL